MLNSVSNEKIEHVYKLLDSGLYPRRMVAKLAGVSRVDVDRIRSGAARPTINQEDYERCEKCGYLVLLPCVACQAQVMPTLLVLAANHRYYSRWVIGRGFSFRQYRYVGGIQHLNGYGKDVGIIRLSRWFDNTYYNDNFLDQMNKHPDVTKEYEDF